MTTATELKNIAVNQSRAPTESEHELVCAIVELIDDYSEKTNVDPVSAGMVCLVMTMAYLVNLSAETVVDQYPETSIETAKLLLADAVGYDIRSMVSVNKPTRAENLAYVQQMFSAFRGGRN